MREEGRWSCAGCERERTTRAEKGQRPLRIAVCMIAGLRVVRVCVCVCVYG